MSAIMKMLALYKKIFSKKKCNLTILYGKKPAPAIFHVSRAPSAVYGQLTRPTHRNGRFLFLGVKIWYICDHLKKNERSKSMFSL